MADATQAVPAALLSRRFLADYVVTMRPYLLFLSGITGFTGMSLAPDLGIVRGSILGLVFFSCYGFGQALTDCFQVDTDSISAPYRPLVRGSVTQRDVFRVSLFGLLCCGFVVTLFNPVTVLPAGLTVIGLATYTPFKRRWWGGPFYNSWIVVLVLVIGYLAAAGSTQTSNFVSRSFCGMIVAVFFGYANFVLTGYYKDIAADRATGYVTFPVKFGLRAASVVSDLLAVGMLAGCAISVLASLHEPDSAAAVGGPALFLASGTAAAVLAQLRVHAVETETEAHSAISLVVHAYILLLSGMATLNKPSWSVPLIVFYLGFLVMMKSRPMEQQI